MAQHKIKQKGSKASLPKGAKQKSLKRVKNSHKAKGPRKGANLSIAPKKLAALNQLKVGAEVSKLINDKNEELVRGRAHLDTGRVSSSTSDKDK